MSDIKTITFKEKELLKEGTTAKGVPWSRYQYYGDDGEHYVLFDNLELEKPYQLTQVTTVSKKDGKSYTNWTVVKENQKAAGAGVAKIMEKLEVMSAEVSDIKRMVSEVLKKTPDAIDVSDMPF